MSRRSWLLRLGLGIALAAILDVAGIAALTLWRAPTGTPDLFVPLGHAGPVRSLAWSPDGNILATGGADAALKFWDPKSGILLRSVAGHDGPVEIAGWSADGQMLATARKNTISLWQADSGILVRSAAEDTVRIIEPVWSPDGTLFAGIVDLESGRGSLGSVRIWRADTGAVVATFGEHFDYIHGVAWSLDSLKLAATGTVLKIWSAGPTDPLAVRSDQTGWLFDSVAFSPDGKLLAERTEFDVQVWRTDSWTVAWKAHDDDGVIDLSWSPGGDMIATATSHGVKLRRAGSGEVVRVFANEACGVAWSPDAKTLASSNCAGDVKLWNAEQGTLVRDLSTRPNSVFAVGWSPDGQTIASGSRDHTVKLWRASTGTLIRALAGHSDEVLSVTWSPDSRALASGSRDRTARLWDAQSGSLLQTIAGVNGRLLAWSPDGRMLAASDDKRMKLWRLDPFKLLRPSDPRDNDILSLAWSPDARIVATGGGHIQFWRADSGVLSIAAPVDHAPAACIAFRPDGQTLANATRLHDGDDRGVIELLKVSHARGAGFTKAQFERYPFGPARPRLITKDKSMRYASDCDAAVWSPDGRLLATAHDDGSIQLWEGDTGKAVRSLSGHLGKVLSVAWSPDSRNLVSGGEDATLRIWNAATGVAESVTTLLPEQEWITVAPGNLLYSSSSHGDEYARIRFGTQWKQIFPLSRPYYRRALKKADVRSRIGEAAPHVGADLWFVAEQVIKDRMLVRVGLLCDGILIGLALLWRPRAVR